jgi:hypothetical protein
MQRHGWTFCFGLLVSGFAAAQPPADSERYPPAPDLPGIVVGKTNTGKPAVSIPAAEPKVVSIQAGEPAPTPRALEGEPVPAGPRVTATTQPAEAKPESPEHPVPATAIATNEKACKSGCRSSNCLDRVMDWMCFQPHARQQGCYPSPNRPPLQAWFPCDPKSGSCPNGKCGSVVPPTVVAPGTPLLTPEPAGPAPKVSIDSESATRQAPAIPIEVDDDLPGAIRVDTGLRFSPGAAPMAKPTTQTDRVSTWRPK